MLFNIIGLALLLFLTPLSAAKPPNLTPRDARIKIEEILKAHVSYHHLSKELIQRSFNNFLDELDPGKTYFLKSEIQKWTEASDELLEKSMENIQRENFSHYQEIQQKIYGAIERRRIIEKQIQEIPLKKGLKVSDFKDLSWAESEEELLERIHNIRSLQFDAAENLDEEVKKQFLKRLKKRRIKREEELSPRVNKQKIQLTLSLTLKSISSALDSQTAYFTPAEANQFMIQVQQRLFGIGAQLRDDLNGFTIVRILDGGPASQTHNLKVKDKIIAVNNNPVVGMDIIEAVELIRGPKGTRVRLTVLRDVDGKEERHDVSLTRGEVVLTETRFDKNYEPFGDGVIGIIHLYSFYQDSKTSSTLDLHSELEKLKTKHNLKGVILDLRNNAGGLLPQAVSVTGLFIKKGIVVSVKDNRGFIQHLRNIQGTMVWDGPLIVLTDRTSASAAEIVSQTLQDYGRAIIVGDESTYGKGTFQTFTLESANYGKINPKGEYKVTRGRYYTVSGKSPQLVGVKADIVVPGIYSEVEIGEKYAKYPLENDQIDPHFVDDLSDVPLMHRNQISQLYKFNLQPILSNYHVHLETLKNNSQLRISQNKDYQVFLKKISYKEELSEEEEESFGVSDLQMNEALNVMKDLILLTQKDTQSVLLSTGTDG